MDRAGFIDAPQIGPANMASKAITPPTATPATIPFSFDPHDTARTTNIRMAESTSSNTKDRDVGPFGSVVPNVACAGNMSRNRTLAANAPINWLATYGTTARPGN